MNDFLVNALNRGVSTGFDMPGMFLPGGWSLGKPKVKKSIVLPDVPELSLSEDKGSPEKTELTINSSSQQSKPETKSVGGNVPDSNINNNLKILDEALRRREGFGYSLASALAAIPQQQGYGTWLSDFARAFGTGMKGSTDKSAERAQKVFDAKMDYLKTMLSLKKQDEKSDLDAMMLGYLVNKGK